MAGLGMLAQGQLTSRLMKRRSKRKLILLVLQSAGLFSKRRIAVVRLLNLAMHQPPLSTLELASL